MFDNNNIGFLKRIMQRLHLRPVAVPYPFWQLTEAQQSDILIMVLKYIRCYHSMLGRGLPKDEIQIKIAEFFLSLSYKVISQLENCGNSKITSALCGFSDYIKLLVDKHERNTLTQSVINEIICIAEIFKKKQIERNLHKERKKRAGKQQIIKSLSMKKVEKNKFPEVKKQHSSKKIDKSYEQSYLINQKGHAKKLFTFRKETERQSSKNKIEVRQSRIEKK